MLPTPAKTVPVGPEWLHEAKLDGFRAQIHVEDGKAILYSRNGADLTKRFRSIRSTIEAIPARSAIIAASSSPRPRAREGHRCVRREHAGHDRSPQRRQRRHGDHWSNVRTGTPRHNRDGDGRMLGSSDRDGSEKRQRCLRRAEGHERRHRERAGCRRRPEVGTKKPRRWVSTETSGEVNFA